MLLPSIFGENLFDDFFDDVPFFDNRAENQIEKKLYGRHAHNVMKTDIKETDDGYELIVDLPGFKKEDINIDIDKDCLTISAERKSEEKEDKGDNGFVRRERYYGSFSRSFNIKGIDTIVSSVVLVNEEIKEILYDMSINTNLKEELDRILFSDIEIRKKRIQIRKLKRKGLENKYIKIFINLLEYIQKI